MMRTQTPGKEDGEIILETSLLAVSVHPELGGGVGWLENRELGVRLGLSRGTGGEEADPGFGRLSFIDRFPAEDFPQAGTGDDAPEELGEFALRPYHAELWERNGGASVLCSRSASVRIGGGEYPFLLRKLYELPAHGAQLRIRAVLDDLTPLSVPFRYGVEFTIVGTGEGSFDPAVVTGPTDRRNDQSVPERYDDARWMKVGLDPGRLAVRLAFSEAVSINRLRAASGACGNRFESTFLAASDFGPEKPPTYALEILLELTTEPGREVPADDR